MVVDNRMLNTQTVHDQFPTPTAGDLISKTRGVKLFSKIDLLSRFHQLRKSDALAHKTAIAMPSGLDEFVCAPFGLTSVPGAFQRFMQFVLAHQIAVHQRLQVRVYAAEFLGFMVSCEGVRLDLAILHHKNDLIVQSAEGVLVLVQDCIVVPRGRWPKTSSSSPLSYHLCVVLCV